MTAVCITPVELYDDGLRGTYQPGDVLEGDKAALALQQYPQYFRPVKPAKEQSKNA